MMYGDLPQIFRGSMELWLLLLQMVYFYCLCQSIQIRNRKALLLVLALNGMNFALFQGLIHYGKEIDSAIVRLRLPVLLPVIAGLTAAAVIQYRYLERWSRERISAASVKKALDVLPTGLCYALPDGLPLLVNEKMNTLSLLLVGTPFMNAEEFREALGGRDKDRFECRLPDGSIYGFRCSEIPMEEGIVVEILAVDLTQEHELTEELREKQRQAKVINTRLRSLLDTIEYLTMSREILQMKVALHENLGAGLLMAKRYLTQPGDVDRQKLVAVWQNNMQHLISEAPEPWQIPYYVISKEAAALGIELEIVGKLPEEEKLLPVIEQAISTHVTNVLRHADGTHAIVRIEEDDDMYRIAFRNDGRPPQGEIRETGGLANLRRKVESAGGRMEITAKPEFEMRLYLPAQRLPEQQAE
ncbi:MAG: hypothetical protein J6M66_07075 [Lachnospiraceae bacterium]|nr:hypothetical protein [Lachnospiraceae bacterium]